jgi:biotin transport system substrate-specific component
MKQSSEPSVVSVQFWARNRSLSERAGLLAVGVLVLAGTSRVSIPVGPVPVTMQTLAVVLIGAVYGWRLGGACVAAWLVAGACGLPVFSEASAGIHKFVGPTAGYLFAFPIAAMAVGRLMERGWDGGRLPRLLVLMLFGHAICLAVGASWLARSTGWDGAWIKGVEPFLVGGALKSVLGALLLALLSAYRRMADTRS